MFGDETTRYGVLLFVLCACGRVSFDPQADGAGSNTNTACAIDVASGRQHGCLVTRTGNVWCWGRNQFGQANPSQFSEVELDPVQVALPRRATSIHAGKYSSCALLEDQSVACWGDNTLGQLGVIDPMERGPVVVPGLAAAEVSLGAQTGCARRATDGGIMCWGEGRYGENGALALRFTPTLIANTIGAQQLRVGHRHACFVDASGAAQCWGRDSNRQLGDMSMVNRTTPTALVGGGSVAMAAAGSRSSCVVDVDGTLRCWGLNEYGQLGDATTIASGTPVAAKVANVADVAIGVAGACALQRDGTLWCWGDVDAGDGTGERGPLARMSLARNVTRVSSGFFNTCVVADGQVLCWGENENGELGRGTRSLARVPVGVDLGGRTPSLLDVGRDHACTASGATVSCWGGNSDGWLGAGNTNVQVRPQDVAPGIGALTGIAASDQNTCAWNANAAACWGRNDFGQNGTGSSSLRMLQPVIVQGLGTPIEQVAIGRSHTCATVGGAVSCWGRNGGGQLGDGSTTDSVTPMSTGLIGVVQIAAGLDHTCAVTSTNVLRCWGGNRLGKLGNGSTDNASTPITITVGTSLPIRQVSAGQQHTCAVTTGGAVYCWGSNVSGQLGLGNTTDHVTPQQVIASGVASVTAGGNTTCAVMMGGTVQCWGASYYGQVPNNSLSNALVPTLIPTLAGADLVQVDELGGCARIGSTVSCWGSNRFLASGDLSDSTPAAPNVPCQ